MYVTSQWFHVTPPPLDTRRCDYIVQLEILSNSLSRDPYGQIYRDGKQSPNCSKICSIRRFPWGNCLLQRIQQAFRWVFGEESRMKINRLSGHLKHCACFPSIYGICAATAYHRACWKSQIWATSLFPLLLRWYQTETLHLCVPNKSSTWICTSVQTDYGERENLQPSATTGFGTAGKC